MSTTTMTELDVLRRARGLLEANWVPHLPRRGTDECCLVEATHGVGETLEQWRCGVRARDRLSQIANAADGLESWNDTHTKEEVLALVDRAIAACEAEG